MSTMMVRQSQGSMVCDGPSVIGERQVRIPVSGKIRAGIKVLTPTAKKANGAEALYLELVQKGEKWDAIEKALKDKFAFDKNPLMPRNIPWFFVRRTDFAMPEVADLIMSKYAEPVEGKQRLQRFPIVFATDSWLTNMPHGLRHFKAGGIVHWSEYSPDGSRMCKQYAPVPVNPETQRAARTFGGRPTMLRPEADGQCVPDNCPEYQGKQCKLYGSLLFYIPGIPGTSAIELPTTSFYALKQWRQVMEIVAFLRGGRISGLDNGKPIFWMTKKEKVVSMLDDAGQPKKVSQWIPELESTITMAGDMPALTHDDDADDHGPDGIG